MDVFRHVFIQILLPIETSWYGQRHVSISLIFRGAIAVRRRCVTQRMTARRMGGESRRLAAQEAVLLPSLHDLDCAAHL